VWSSASHSTSSNTQFHLRGRPSALFVNHKPID
jgi:hypothetical protein